MNFLSKTVRFQQHINAMVVLEQHVVEDFVATEQRGQVSRTIDNVTVTVYPDAFKIKVTGSSKKVDFWCKKIELLLGNLQDISVVEDFLDPSITKDTRRYIESVVRQINDSVKIEAFDGASVLIRRLVETLIIELFEGKGTSHEIKNSSGDFFQLSDLVATTIAQSDSPACAWNLGRNTKKGLQDIKEHGDLSAHNRRYIARESDITRLRTSLRVVVEELLTVSGLK